MDANEGFIEVGATGTIGSLISKELETIKHSPFSRKMHQTSPFLVHYSATISKKPIKKNAPQNDFSGSNSSNSSSSSSSSSSSNSSNSSSSSSSNYNYKCRRSVQCDRAQVPILRLDEISTERNSNADAVGKKQRVFAVEVVDIKCDNLFSRRPRKIGFSKLSSSIA